MLAQPHSAIRRFVGAVALVLVAGSASAAEELVRCTASARECEMQIRSMLAGRTYLGVKLGESRWGIVIKSIVADSPAAAAGLRVGDRIFAINGNDMSKADISEFKRTLNEAKAGGRLSLGIVRVGTILRVMVRVEQMSQTQIDKIVAAHLKEAHSGDGRGIPEPAPPPLHVGGNH